MPRVSADRVIVEIIRKAEGELTGKMRLFKAFYFAHLIYSETHPGTLTDWQIAHMPEGPGIHRCDDLLNPLVKKGYLTIEHVHENIYPEFRFRLLEKSKELEPLGQDESIAIQR